MKPTKCLFQSLAVLLLLLVAGPGAAAPKPVVLWSPSSLELTADAGSQASATVQMSVAKRLSAVQLSVAPELAGFVTVTPDRFDLLAAGETQTITVGVAVPASTAPAPLRSSATSPSRPRPRTAASRIMGTAP